MTTTIQTIRDDFSFLDEWEDRYRYVIELGEALPPFPDEERNAANKVPGCVSQVWLTTERGPGAIRSSPSRAIPTPISCAGWSRSCWRCFPDGPASEIQKTDAEATLKAARPGRAPVAAARQRSSLDGQAHQARCRDGAEADRLIRLVRSHDSCVPRNQTAPEGAVDIGSIRQSSDYRALRLRPRPIFLASCERAAA